MKQQRLTGPEAGALKYDVLTALSLLGLSGTATVQTSMMRLIALVTARYNWRLDEFSVGQRDMARMWAINERSVKREIKRLTESGILVCTRGGVRGRVGAYRMDQHRIAALSEPSWALVGPDYAARMGERYRQSGVKVVQLNDYKQNAPADVPNQTAKPGTWASAMADLSRQQPDLFGAWFSRLEFQSFEHGTLRLKAPSGFIQRYIETHLLRILTDAVEQELGPIDRIVFA